MVIFSSDIPPSPATWARTIRGLADAEIRETVEALARYLIPSCDVLRQADKEAMATSIRDLRETERRSSPHMMLMRQISAHFTPRELRNRPNVSDLQYEGADTPANLQNFPVHPGALSAFPMSNQDMANAISLELARGARKLPDCTPFIIPHQGGAPWPVSPNDHTSAVQRRMNNARQSKREEAPNALPSQARILRHLRFSLTEEIFAALPAFGGLEASVNHLSIVLNIATIDTNAAALAYDRAVMLHMAEKASDGRNYSRRRIPRVFSFY